MRTRIIIIFLVLLFGGTDAYLFCQEKTQSYYNQHPEEILKDAQSSFKRGEYGQTISLCKLHYIIVGDSAADALRGKAELCERLTNEIKERTEELRTANPDDPTASKLDPVKTVLDSSQGIVNGVNSTEGLGDGDATQDNETDTIIEVEKNINGYQWVDLGLPSGLKWATKNIGAQTNSNLGFFFSWEEIKRKGSEATYIIKSKAAEPLNAYETLHSSTQKDAATVSWGAPWRMPNDKDWVELKMFCNWRWLVMNGHPGYLVVSIKNGNSIFLPASGYFGTRDNRDVGQQGYYWSFPSQDSEQRKGNCFFFNVNRMEMKTFPSSYRLSIRAVSD